MKKAILKATDPLSGQVFTRQTHRQYSHVVIADRVRGDIESVAWCGRLDLAEKRAAAIRADDANVLRQPHGLFSAVRVIPVDSPAEGGC